MERLVRVNELLKRELGMLFERNLSDFRDCLVTVTEVKTAPNLRRAIVRFSVYGGGAERPAKILAELRRQRSDLQHELTRNVKLKYTPVLDFHLDDQGDKTDRVLHLLDKLEKDPPS
jgi:ribosome-binding factor A